MAKTRFGDRPEDKITIEEWRLMIAAMAGPRRLMYGRHNAIVLTANVPARLALNRSAVSLFVDVRAVPAVAIGATLFSPQSSADTSSSISVDLSATNFDQVLLMTEELWALVTVSTVVMVTEVQV